MHGTSRRSSAHGGYSSAPRLTVGFIIVMAFAGFLSWSTSPPSPPPHAKRLASNNGLVQGSIGNAENLKDVIKAAPASLKETSLVEKAKAAAEAHPASNAGAGQGIKEGEAEIVDDGAGGSAGSGSAGSDAGVAGSGSADGGALLPAASQQHNTAGGDKDTAGSSAASQRQKTAGSGKGAAGSAATGDAAISVPGSSGAGDEAGSGKQEAAVQLAIAANAAEDSEHDSPLRKAAKARQASTPSSGLHADSIDGSSTTFDGAADKEGSAAGAFAGGKDNMAAADSSSSKKAVQGDTAGAGKAAGAQALADDTAEIADSDYAAEAKSTKGDGEGGGSIAAAKTAADRADAEQPAGGVSGSRAAGVTVTQDEVTGKTAAGAAAQRKADGKAANKAAGSKASPEDEVVLTKLAKDAAMYTAGSSSDVRAGSADAADRQSEEIVRDE